MELSPPRAVYGEDTLFDITEITDTTTLHVLCKDGPDEVIEACVDEILDAAADAGIDLSVVMGGMQPDNLPRFVQVSIALPRSVVLPQSRPCLRPCRVSDRRTLLLFRCSGASV